MASNDFERGKELTNGRIDQAQGYDPEARSFYLNGPNWNTLGSIALGSGVKRRLFSHERDELLGGIDAVVQFAVDQALEAVRNSSADLPEEAIAQIDNMQGKVRG